MKKNKKIKTERQIERQKKIIADIKGILVPIVVMALIVGGVFLAARLQNKAPVEEIIHVHSYSGDGKDVVMENDDLIFTLDPDTTQFTVEVKESGKVWRSNPENAKNDTVALTDEKSRLTSPLLLTYSVVAGLEVTYATSDKSVANGIYDITQGEDYVRVDYSIGNVSKEFICPPVMTEDDFNAWLDRLSDEGKNFIAKQECYKKYDINKLSKRDNEEELRETYPIIADTVIRVLRDNTKDQVRAKLEEYFGEAGYTYEDYEAHKALIATEGDADHNVFNASMIYRLDGSDLVVEVPFDSLESKSATPIYKLTPLPYFGAGGKDDEGFILVPEGGGSLIRFNNGKTAQAAYFANVYGWDMCLTRDSVVHNTRAYYGVYGIAEGDDSFICILEDGSSYGSIQADISGRVNSYNYVNTVYTIKNREKYKVGDIANSDIYQYQSELPDESLVQRYRFVHTGSYVDMAKVYGSYLQDKYGDSLAMNSDTSTPVALEIVGAVDKVKQILGVPVSRPLKLTTYKEAGEIIEDMVNRGVDNLSVRLSGWANGGVNQKILTDISTISDLGGKKQLEALAQKSSSMGVDLYLNGITQYAFDSNIFDGFFSYRDAAKLISKERAELFEYSPVTYGTWDGTESYWLLHTELAGKMTDNLTGYAKKLGANVSFQDLGMDLSADYDRKNTYSREAVLNIQEQQLKDISGSGTKVMINMGNDYAVPYASMVTGMDLRGSEYTILDECVPFFQMAVHGRVNYTGAPINIGGNEEQNLLYAAEYGAGLYFTVMKESAFALQKTLYTEYYGSSYDSWREEFLSIYNRYNEELGHTFNQEMTGHENITPMLSCTEYADGTRVYVNYGYSDAETDGVTVPARDYMVVR